MFPPLIIWVVSVLLSIPSLMMVDAMTNLDLASVIGVLGFLISLALYLTLPKLLFKLDWKTGILTGLVWRGFMLVVGLILGAFVAAIIAALAFGAAIS